MANYKTTLISSIREKVGDGKVLLALSGGVDSSVAAKTTFRSSWRKLDLYLS